MNIFGALVSDLLKPAKIVVGTAKNVIMESNTAKTVATAYAKAKEDALEKEVCREVEKELIKEEIKTRTAKVITAKKKRTATGNVA